MGITPGNDAPPLRQAVSKRKWCAAGPQLHCDKSRDAMQRAARRLTSCSLRGRDDAAYAHRRSIPSRPAASLPDGRKRARSGFHKRTAGRRCSPPRRPTRRRSENATAPPCVPGRPMPRKQEITTVRADSSRPIRSTVRPRWRCAADGKLCSQLELLPIGSHGMKLSRARLERSKWCGRVRAMPSLSTLASRPEPSEAARMRGTA